MARLPRLRRWAPAIIAGVGVAVTLAAGVVAPFATTTLAWPAIAALTAGTVAASALLRGWAGVLIAAVLICRLASLWVGWQVSQHWSRALAAAVAPLLAPVLLAVVLLPPDGRPRLRRPLWAAFAAVGLLAVLAVAWRDPLRDLGCTIDCSAPRPPTAWASGAQVAATTLDVLGFLLAAAGIALLTTGLLRATRGDRAWTGLVALPAAAALIASALEAALLLELALVWLGLGVTAAAGRVLRRRRLVARLAERLSDSPEPGALGAALAPLLGSGVRVGYRLTDAERFVTEDGQEIDRPHGAATVELRRADQAVAVLATDDPVADLGELQEAIGSAARVAIDNARLQAELAARFVELTESRARIVATADDTRRRVERDLHDGAQAGLISLLTLFGLARAEAEQAGDYEEAERLAGLTARTGALIQRLRALTHGIFPSVLDQLGLEPALHGLVAERDGVTQLTVSGEQPGATDPRWKEANRAAYLIVAEACHAAGALQVAVHLEASRLTLRLTGATGEIPVSLADRVGAAGGTIEAHPDRWEAVIPCAS